MEKVIIKRVYEAEADTDGYRVLVDRLWPRGVSKEKAKINEWCKEIAPSNELRKWFGHDPLKFETFSEKYHKELTHQQKWIQHLYAITQKQQLCLVYGAKDELHNQAVVLKKILDKGEMAL